MHKQEIELYYFNELEPNIQEMILQKYWDFNVYYGWTDMYLKEWKTKLDSIGFKNAEIHFSGFYSQGDGTSFDADIDTPQILNTLIMCYNKQDGLQAEKCSYLTDYIKFYINKNGYSHHYCHEKTRYTAFEIYDIDKPYWNKILDNLTGLIENLRLDLCKTIYKELQQEYEYLTSDESVKESIIANELEFFKNGRTFNTLKIGV